MMVIGMEKKTMSRSVFLTVESLRLVPRSARFSFLLQVIVRIRPLNNRELSVQGPKRCTRQDGPSSLTFLTAADQQLSYNFDHVVGEHISQVCSFFSYHGPLPFFSVSFNFDLPMLVRSG